MTFSEYVKTCHKYIETDMYGYDFIPYFCQLMMGFPQTTCQEQKDSKDDFYPFSSIKTGTISDIYSGKNTPSKKDLKKLSDHLDGGLFIEEIRNLPKVKKKELKADFINLGAKIEDDDIADALVDIFENLLSDLLSQNGTQISNKKTESNKNTNPSFALFFNHLVQYNDLFVETEFYKKSLAIIEKTRKLLIIGAPGVGKTATSVMIAKKYMETGFEFSCAFDMEEIPELLLDISNNPTKKELIYIDDCLGQAYFDLNSYQENELKKLISFVEQNDQKYILLNSRITICNSVLNEEKKLSPTLCKLMDQGNILQIEELSELERAKIFYNHLYYSKSITNEHYKSLQPEERYLEVINHENYTPRIMEYVTSAIFLSNIPIKDYYDKIVEALDNPTKIWKDEYNNKIEKKDRLLLTTLFSLTDKYCKYNLLKKAYEKRISIEPDIDSSKNNWETVLSVLNGSMITIFEQKDERFVKVINPSINDFLRNNVMLPDSNEVESLKKTLVCTAQVERLFGEQGEEILVSMIRDESILNMEFLSEYDKDRQISGIAIAIKEKNIKYKCYILNHLYFKHTKFGFTYLFDSFCQENVLLSLLKDPELFHFYLDGENIPNLLETSLRKTGITGYFFLLLEQINSLPKGVYDLEEEKTNKLIKSLIEEKVEEYNNDHIFDYIGDIINSGADEEDDDIASDVDERIYEELYDISVHSSNIPADIIEYYEDQLSYMSCTAQDVEAYRDGFGDATPYEESKIDLKTPESDPIADLFEKEFLK